MKAEVTIQYPKTARDAAVILVEQILTAMNNGQVIGADETYQRRLDKWKERAALILSDAKTEQS